MPLWWNGNESMENKRLPSSLSRCFLLGLGFGTGIAIVVYVTRRYFKQNNNHGVVLAIRDVSKEIRELRGVMVAHLDKTSNVFNEKPRKLYRVESSQRVATVGGALVESRPGDESTSEDEDFYDLLDDDVSNLSLQVKSQDIARTIKECDELCERNETGDDEEQIQMLEDILQISSDNPEILWRLGRAYKVKLFSLTESYNAEEEEELIKKAIDFTQKALDIEEENGDAHKWAAILIGLRAERQTAVTEKAASAQKMQQHILKAVRFKPKDPAAHFLMGRFLFEFADLPWWQRHAAALVFEIPSCTFEDALSSFDKADKLSNGDFKSNTLFIGKCYHRLGDLTKSTEWLNKCLDIPVQDAEDKQSAEEATTMLQALA